MSFFVKSTPAAVAKSDISKQVAILFAGILALFAVAQLFTFEAFLEIVPALGLPISDSFAYILPSLIIVFEVFAIPFLLRMRLSIAFRWLSMFLGWLVVAVWLFITIWTAVTPTDVATVGFLGSIGDLAPGWWAVCVSIALGILSAWASWGLWPTHRAKMS